MTNVLNYLKVQKIDITKVYCTVIDWPVISTDTFCSWWKDTALRRQRKCWVTLSLSASSVRKPSRKPRATSSSSKALLQSCFLVSTFPSTRAKIGITRNGHGLHKQIVTRFMASTPPTTSYFLHFWWLHNDLNTSGFESQRPEFLNIENWWSYKPHNIKKLNFILTTSFRVLNLLEWFSFFCLWIFGSLYNTHVAKHVISHWAKRKACLAKKD